MADQTQFEKMQEQKAGACAVCEAMLPDAVDGALSPAEQRAFDIHVAGCVACAQELEDAQRGAAWLTMLKVQTPEPPADLLAKILAGTTGAVTAAAAAPNPAFVPEPLPEWATRKRGGSFGSRVSSFGSKLAGVFSFDNARATFQPRFAMTAAMAFFSVALTLNLTGVRLRDLRAANFTPGGMKRTVADMSASATRSFQNLRVVYQVESRVSELREDEKLNNRQPESAGGAQQNDDAAPKLNDGVLPQSAPQNTAAPKSNDGVQGGTGDSQPAKEPKPQGSSDLVIPVPQRSMRGGLVARKEV